MDDISTLQTIMSTDPLRWRLFQHVRALDLPDCWIAAGFVRNAVWDHLHDRALSPVSTDVDVIWFDAEHCTAEHDKTLEAALRAMDPSVVWSVKNQARMHIRNGDEPYLCATDAMRYWPETATAVAVRLGRDGTCDVAAPLGLEDLFGLIVRPTHRFVTQKRAIFEARFESKRWMSRWPALKLAADSLR